MSVVYNIDDWEIWKLFYRSYNGRLLKYQWSDYSNNKWMINFSYHRPWIDIISCIQFKKKDVEDLWMQEYIDQPLCWIK